MRRIGTFCSLVFLLTLVFAVPRAAARPGTDPERYNRLLSASINAFNANHLKTSITRATEAVAEGEKVYGPDHPEMARPFTYIAFAYLQMGDFDQAKAFVIRARAIRDKNKNAVPEKVNQLMDTIANVVNRPRPYDSAIKPGAAPTDFKGKGLDGNPVALKDYAGKVVLIDFWATWCPPCRAEVPHLVELHKKYAGKGFDILGVSLDGPDQKKVIGFTQQNGMPWRHVYDGGGWEATVSRKYGVRSIPFTVLVGKDGKILAVGARSSVLEGLLEEMLGN
jgi:thiol-disulfide isomerase/thioredoxin